MKSKVLSILAYCSQNNITLYCELLSKLIKMGPPLWSRGNVVASHLEGPGSIPIGSVFLVEVFSGVFLNRNTNVKKT